MLDAMIAFALKTRFRKKVSVGDQCAQTYDRFLRGRQIAQMIYEHFRASGACKAVQGLSDLFKIRLQKDDVQDFDVRRDHALYYQQTKFLRKWSWKDYTSQNCRIARGMVSSRRSTGGGGLARVPNVRVCKHLRLVVGHAGEQG